jgi:hypothetical protein
MHLSPSASAAGYELREPPSFSPTADTELSEYNIVVFFFMLHHNCIFSIYQGIFLINKCRIRYDICRNRYGVIKDVLI